MKKLLCKLFGHSISIRLYREVLEHKGVRRELTTWKCVRCEKTWREQWDEF